jgi:hypothetical protein
MTVATGQDRRYEQGTRRRPSVDRDALLHSYTVALAHGWLVPGLTWAYEQQGDVVSKSVPAIDAGCDTGLDGARASESSKALRQRFTAS